MRILVGTLRTIEQEFDRSAASVRAQHHPEVEHLVIEGLPNLEAHDALFREFAKRADTCELLIKVDADMVLARDDLFTRIVEIFRGEPRLKNFEIQVHDFFTDRLIWGLNAFRRSTRWSERFDPLFTDRGAEAGLAAGEKRRDDGSLAPAAWHCPDPSPFQALHYGVHRGLKVVQPLGAPIDAHASWQHWENYRALAGHAAREPDDTRLLLALIGHEIAFAGGVSPAWLDAGDPRLPEALERLAPLRPAALRARLARLRRGNWGFVPSTVRRHLLVRRARSRGR